MKRTAFLTALLITGSTVFAQRDTLELAPVEVQALRAGARAPFTKTNIARAQIERANLGQDLPFLLNQTPSVVVNSDAGNGVGYTGIRIRGTDATRINITINGIPFNDPESNGAFFVNLPDILSSTGSIQVQRGVGTSSNGPASFGATINLSTNEPREKPFAEVDNTYGSFNTRKHTVKAGTGLIGKHFSFEGRLSQIASDGYIDRATSDLRSWYFSGAWQNQKSSLRFTTFHGREKTYQAWYGVSQADLGSRRTFNSAGTERPGDPYPNETDNYTQRHYQLFFNHRFNPRWTFNTGLFYVRGIGYYEQYKANRRYSSIGLPDQIQGGVSYDRTDLVRQLWLDNHHYGSVYSLHYQKGKTRLTFGGQASRYLGDHYGFVTWAQRGLPDGRHRFYFHDAVKNDFNIYGKWEQQLSAAFTAYTDLQLRTVSYRINGFRDNPDVNVNQRYAFFNPKAGIHFQEGNWRGFASFGIAHKEPNRDDFEAGATELPRPEQLQDLEVQIGQQRRKSSWSATFYYMNYRNQLVLTGRINDVGAYTRTNIARSFRTGIELEGGLQATPWLKASGNLAFSRNRIKNFTEFIDDYDNGTQKTNQYRSTPIAFSPDVVGAATLTLTPIRNVEADLIGKYVGAQYLDNTGNAARRLDAYYEQSLRLVYNFSWKRLKNVRITGQVNNLFNTLYEPNGYTFSYISGGQLTTENFFYPMAGINWTLGLNLRF